MYIVGHQHPASAVPCQLCGGVLPIVSCRSGVSNWDRGSFVLPVYENSLSSPWAGRSISWLPWSWLWICIHDAFTRLRVRGRSWHFSQAFISLRACLFAGGNEIVITYMWSTDLWGSSSVFFKLRVMALIKVAWGIFLTLVEALLIHDSMNEHTHKFISF